MTTEAIGEFSLDDVEVKDNKIEKFMVEKGKEYRIGFPLLNENKRVFIQEVKHYSLTLNEGTDDEEYLGFRISSDPKVNQAVEEFGGEVETHYVTVVVKYSTDKGGNPTKPLLWECLPVKLNGKKVANLKTLNDEWDLATVDLKVSSDNPAYQYHTYSPLKKAIWRFEDGNATLKALGLEESIEKKVMEAANELKSVMADAIAPELKDAYILRRIGKGGDASGDSGVDVDALDEEFADLGEGDLG